MLTIRPIIVMFIIELIIAKITSYLIHFNDFIKVN
jgi:hypothetical protein